MSYVPFTVKMTEEQITDKLRSLYGSEFTTADIKAFCSMNDIHYNTVTRKLQKYKVSKGKWNLEVTTKAVENIENAFAAPAVTVENLVPEKDETFVPFGSFADVKRIVKSKIFYPTFITGLSGNGKTFSVEQACAQLGRELIRVNITIETDEDDLIGGFRLVNQSSKLSTEEQSCSLTRSTLHPTRSSAFNQSLREMVYSLKRLADLLDPPEDSTYSPPQILKVRVQTTEDLLELTCSTKPSSKDSQLPLSNPTPQ